MFILAHYSPLAKSMAKKFYYQTIKNLLHIKVNLNKETFLKIIFGSIDDWLEQKFKQIKTQHSPYTDKIKLLHQRINAQKETLKNII